MIRVYRDNTIESLIESAKLIGQQMGEVSPLMQSQFDALMTALKASKLREAAKQAKLLGMAGKSGNNTKIAKIRTLARGLGERLKKYKAEHPIAQSKKEQNPVLYKVQTRQIEKIKKDIKKSKEKILKSALELRNEYTDLNADKIYRISVNIIDYAEIMQKELNEFDISVKEYTDGYYGYSNRDEYGAYTEFLPDLEKYSSLILNDAKQLEKAHLTNTKDVLKQHKILETIIKNSKHVMTICETLDSADKYLSREEQKISLLLGRFDATYEQVNKELMEIAKECLQSKALPEIKPTSQFVLNNVAKGKFNPEGDDARAYFKIVRLIGDDVKKLSSKLYEKLMKLEPTANKLVEIKEQLDELDLELD